MTGHNLINTGAGWRCLKCGIAWDQGEDTSGECESTLAEIPTIALPDTPEAQSYVEAIERHKDKITAFGSQMIRTAIGDIEPMRDDVGDRRFFPITDVIEGGSQSPTTVRPYSMPLRPDPMKRQVGASHYRKLAIQPTEFCQRNGLDFCIGSILKYLTRYRAKNGIEDLRKARHFVEIREAFPWHIRPPNGIEITMVEYVTRNNIIASDAEALYRLEAYYNGHEYLNDVAGGRARAAERLIAEIDKLIAAMG